MNNTRIDKSAKILVLDDNPVIRKMVKQIFEEKERTICEKRRKILVSEASDIRSAKNIVTTEDIKLCIVDINLGYGEDGKDFCKYLRLKFPCIKIILTSGYVGIFSTTKPYLYDVSVQKPVNLKCLDRIAMKLISDNNEIAKTSNENEEKSLFCTHIQMEDKYTVGMYAITKREMDKKAKERRCVKFVIYKLNENKPITIGLSSSMGCIGRCRFCRSYLNKIALIAARNKEGKERKKNFENLNTEEIIDQIIIAKNSEAMSVFQKDREKDTVEINVNFTCEGDFLVQNSKEQIIEVIRKIDKIEFISGIIITTIGSERGFRNLLNAIKENKEIFRKVKIYWSLNSVEEKKRSELMRSTGADDIFKMRDILYKCAVELDAQFSLSYVLIKNFNDSKKDVLEMKKFIAGKDDYFEYKIQGLKFLRKEYDIIDELELEERVPCDQEVEKYCQTIAKEKIRFRAVEVLNYYKDLGCGSTCGFEIGTRYEHTELSEVY